MKKYGLQKNPLIHHSGKYWRNKHKHNWKPWSKTNWAVKSLQSSGKEPPSIISFNSEKIINLEIMNELETIKEQKPKKMIEETFVTKNAKLRMIFEKFETIQAFPDVISNGIVTIDMESDGLNLNFQC